MTHSASSNSTFLEFIFSVYKVYYQTRVIIDVGVQEVSEARLHKLNVFTDA